MTIELTSEKGFMSASATKLGRQVVIIKLDGKEIGFLSGDELAAQLFEQGFKIEEV
jgi:hypothetical protein